MARQAGLCFGCYLPASGANPMKGLRQFSVPSVLILQEDPGHFHLQPIQAQEACFRGAGRVQGFLVFATWQVDRAHPMA